MLLLRYALVHLKELLVLLLHASCHVSGILQCVSLDLHQLVQLLALLLESFFGF